MFKIIPKQEMISKIDEALTSRLADVVLICPDLREKIIQNFMWAIFSDRQSYETPEWEKVRHQVFALMSYDIVQQAKEQLEKNGELQPQFFAPKVDQDFQKKDYMTYLDYEDCDVLVQEVPKIEKKIQTEFEGTISITLPDSYVIFKEFFTGDLYSDADKWVFEYMDIYEAWRFEVMDNLYRYEVQVGGHGRWIQGDYNDTYVAQFNIDIGDAGSVFMEMREATLRGGVDMY